MFHDYNIFMHDLKSSASISVCRGLDHKSTQMGQNEKGTKAIEALYVLGLDIYIPLKACRGKGNQSKQCNPVQSRHVSVSYPSLSVAFLHMGTRIWINPCSLLLSSSSWSWLGASFAPLVPPGAQKS
jgi:hypothetical protein